jgi:membrane peptidoglycan carboxypeptidase
MIVATCRVTLAEAFAKSINTATARLAQQVGLKQVIAAARDLGLSGPLPAVPSLALGTAEVNLLELTAAYGCIGRISRRRNPPPPVEAVRLHEEVAAATFATL